MSKFLKNEHFLLPDTHTHVCISGGKKWLFFGKFYVLFFLETPVLRFALLPYYRRIRSVTETHYDSDKQGVEKKTEYVEKKIPYSSGLFKKTTTKKLQRLKIRYLMLLDKLQLPC